MEKLITVQRTSQGKKNTQGISLQGDYLKKHGFEIGDFVKVVISKNKITIEKNVSTELLNAMGTKNPALFTLIEGLGLTV